MDVLEKLTILTDAAKYDAACTSSGGNRTSKRGYIGNTGYKPDVMDFYKNGVSAPIGRFNYRYTV